MEDCSAERHRPFRPGVEAATPARLPDGDNPLPEDRYVPRGLLLQWHITERCNLRCAHCYQEASTEGDELEFSEWLGVLDQFESLLAAWKEARPTLLPWAQVTVTGGEPFMHRDLPRLLEEIAQRRPRIRFAVLTNGWFIDPTRANWLAALEPRFVQVSLDGERETHDRIRGRGAFDRAVSGLAALRRAGVPTSVSFTAHRGNFREFPGVVAVARRLGADRVWSDRLIPCGTGAGLESELLSPAETREYFATMAELRHRASRIWSDRTEVAMHRALQFHASGSLPYRCTAGDSLITLLPNGDVVPCRRMPIPVGNLRATSLAEIYNGSELLRRLRNPGQVSRGCEPCAFRHRCRGGLRCLSHALNGDPFVADPGCWLADPGQSADGTPGAPGEDPSSRQRSYIPSSSDPVKSPNLASAS